MHQWKQSGLVALILVTSITWTTSSVFAAEQNAASVSGNVSAVSTYVWRGIPQTADAALQGGIDVSTAEGIHAGVWTSNVTFGSELDFTVGFAGKAKGFGFDVGLIVYNFPQYEEQFTGDYNFNELYIGFSKDFLGVNFYTSADAGNYLEVNATFAKAISNWDLGLHLGAYDVDEDFDGLAYAGGDDYNDYSASLSTEINGMEFSFILSDTSIDDDPYRSIVKVSKSF